MAAAGLKQEPSYFGPPPLSVATIQQANANTNYGVMQQTPTATETSKGSSPDFGPAISQIPRAPSPLVRVEKWSRGDSPARSTGLAGVVRGKRSRAGSRSSHLAVQDGGSSSDEDEGNSEGHYNVSANGLEGSGDGRKGLDPKSRFRVSGVDVPSLKDQEDSANLASRNADVEEWLDRSATKSDVDPTAPSARPRLHNRQRARSTGAQTLSKANLESLHYAAPDDHIPGPGVLIDEDSGDDDSLLDDDGTASIENSPPPTTALGAEPVNEIPGEAQPGVYNEVPNQPELYRAKFWHDPLYDSSDPGVKMQPASSNDAIARFQQRARDMETLSRVATWGTRRMSDSDLHSLFRQFSISDSPRDPTKPKRDRSGSFLQQAAARLKPRRNATAKGSIKRPDVDGTKKEQTPIRPVNLEHSRKDSAGSGNLGVPHAPSTGLKRIPSLSKRPRSPRINTSSAVAAVTSQVAGLGATGSVSATGTSSPTGPWTMTKNVIKRSRSRSELNAVNLPTGLGLHGTESSSTTELGLAGLWEKQGGPPMPTLAAPKAEEMAQHGLGDEDDDDDDDVGEDHGVKMDLSIRPDPIVPTLEGFKANIRQLNPRLPPFMFDRIAQEQLRRYKKLLDFKLKHAQALAGGKCPSGKHCIELGGEPTYLPSKSSGKDADPSQAGFSFSGLGPSDDDVNALAEGVVTPAQFPPGVPMPPVKRLPAEFECSLCFKVKKFHKPSDWSKHVHEDVQPFTCTFATCAEPKSFKRKADWVRHENERHRQLEWWMCNMNDCSHKCYRKDNFVQHLVREHKLPEPKVKTLKAGKPAVRGPSSQKARNARVSDDNGDESHDEVEQVWRLVEECRHETPKNPKDEPCKFCGNICNTWKKLTVHLAKHMEQISMPVLGVVKQKEVTAETIISPIEQRLTAHQTSMSPQAQSTFSQNPLASYNQPMVGLDETMNGLHPLQNTAYYNNAAAQQAVNYRVSPSTYPPPHQAHQLAANYGQSRHESPYPVSDYTNASYANSPAPSYATQRGYPPHPSSSPEAMYTSNDVHGPTSQPRSSPFDEGKGFQYMNASSHQQQQHQPSQQPQQQQQFVNSPIEGSIYQFGTSSNAASYSQQQQQNRIVQAHTVNPSQSFPQQSQMVSEMPLSLNSGMGVSYPPTNHPHLQQSQNPQVVHNMGGSDNNGMGETIYMHGQGVSQAEYGYQ